MKDLTRGSIAYLAVSRGEGRARDRSDAGARSRAPRPQRTAFQSPWQNGTASAPGRVPESFEVGRVRCLGGLWPDYLCGPV